MGLIELIKLAFTDDKIFIPLDNESVEVLSNGRYIWDKEPEPNKCQLDDEQNMEQLKKLVDSGLPEKPEGEAPEFKLD